MVPKSPVAYHTLGLLPVCIAPFALASPRCPDRLCPRIPLGLCPLHFWCSSWRRHLSADALLREASSSSPFGSSSLWRRQSCSSTFETIPNRRGEHPFRIARMSAIDAGIHAILGTGSDWVAYRVLILGWSGSHRTPHAIRIGQLWGAYSFLCLVLLPTSPTFWSSFPLAPVTPCA